MLDLGLPFWRSPRIERAANAAALAAGVWFVLAMGWELFGPLPGGHLGNVAGSAMAGENMLHWKLFAAVTNYVPNAPGPEQFYTHHPYGVFLLQALCHALFGHSWATTRIGAVVLSSLSVLLLHRLSRALWGAVPAAVAVLIFAVTPINLAFGQFTSLEVTTIAFGLLFSWASARFFQTWARRYFLLATLGALGAVNSDWVGLVLVGVTGIFAFARAYVLPRHWLGPVDDRRHATWFAWVTAVSVGTLLLYLLLFAKGGHLADLLSSYQGRSSGADAPFSRIFGPRRTMWLLWMLPPAALVAIALGLPAHLARLARRRRFEEALPVAWLAAASFQYLVFRQGADVHIFWPHYYGVCAPLGAGALTACALSLASKRRARDEEQTPARKLARDRIALALAIAPGAIAALLLGRVGVVQLQQSRLTGGRFDDGGRYIAVDQDRSAFAAWVSGRLPKGGIVTVHRSFSPTWNVEYGIGRPLRETGSLLGLGPQGNTAGMFTAEDPNRFALLDTRFASIDALRATAQGFQLDLWGPFALIDRASPHGPPRAFMMSEQQPGWLERYFVTGTDLIRSFSTEEDPFASWEWRDHLGLPAPRLAAEPRTAEQARIAFNAAASEGAEASSLAHLRQQAESLITTPLRVPFTTDVTLLGYAVEEGAATVVTLLFETGPAFKNIDADFLVRSRITEAPLLWSSATDYFEKETAPPAVLRPGLWKPSRLYVHRYIDMRRVGTERFEGMWTSRDGTAIKTLDGQSRIELFVLR